MQTPLQSVADLIHAQMDSKLKLFKVSTFIMSPAVLQEVKKIFNRDSQQAKARGESFYYDYTEETLYPDVIRLTVKQVAVDKSEILAETIGR